MSIVTATNAYGDKSWLQNGQYHRLDGPAIEYADGDKYWYQNGQSHRLDGPAVEYASGTKAWYQNDQLHRLDGPAIECANGSKYWYQNGKYHRLDGPAIEYANGSKSWYIEGVEYSQSEHEQKIAEMNNASPPATSTPSKLDVPTTVKLTELFLELLEVKEARIQELEAEISKLKEKI